jgi:hypothetical protein
MLNNFRKSKSWLVLAQGCEKTGFFRPPRFFNSPPVRFLQPLGFFNTAAGDHSKSRVQTMAANDFSGQWNRRARPLLFPARPRAAARYFI